MKKLFDVIIRGYGYHEGLEYQYKFIGLSLGQAISKVSELKRIKDYLFSDIITVDFYDYGTTDKINFIVIPLFAYNTLKHKDMTVIDLVVKLHRISKYDSRGIKVIKLYHDFLFGHMPREKVDAIYHEFYEHDKEVQDEHYYDFDLIDYLFEITGKQLSVNDISVVDKLNL